MHFFRQLQAVQGNGVFFHKGGYGWYRHQWVKIMSTHKPMTFEEKVKVGNFNKTRDSKNVPGKTPNVTQSIKNGHVLDSIFVILSFIQAYRQT